MQYLDRPPGNNGFLNFLAAAGAGLSSVLFHPLGFAVLLALLAVLVHYGLL